MKDDVLFDSDKCIWKRDFGYDSMSLKEFDEYANIAATFIGHFVDSGTENLSIDMNRLNKKFHLTVFSNSFISRLYAEGGCYQN